MTKLSELKVGDKATVEIEITRKGDLTEFKLGGSTSYWCALTDGPILPTVEVTNVVCKLIEPAAGQVWAWRADSKYTYKIIFADEKSVLIEDFRDSARIFHPTEYFMEHMTYVRRG